MDKRIKQVLDNYRGKLRIDRLALDDGIEEHASLFYEISEEHALAMSRRDTAKAAMDEVYSISADQVRRDFSESKDKHTEAQIKEAVVLDPDYLAAIAQYQDRAKEAALLGAMKDSFEQRGRMLRELAQLYISGYFSITSVRGSEFSAKQAVADRARDLLNQGRKDKQSRPKINRR